MNDQLNFTDKKSEYLDKEALDIVELIKESAISDQIGQKLTGSMAHQKVNDWSDKLVKGPTIRYITNSLNQKIAVLKEFEGITQTIDKEAYIRVSKLINNIFKDSKVRSSISEKFVETKTIKWLFKAFEDRDISYDFCDYLLKEMNNSIEDIKIHYPILHLDICRLITFGNTEFGYFTKEYFDNLEKSKTEDIKASSESYQMLKDSYQGMVYVACHVRAEKTKANDIALEECSLAVDVLKMFSVTSSIPTHQLSFDIDCRTRENLMNQIITTSISQPENFTITKYRLPNHHRLSERELKQMDYLGMGVFHHFIKELPEERSELQMLIINGIKRYGNAISNGDLHQRTVELFTLLESLLLNDENSPIMDTVCKYCSKIIAKDPKDRKETIQTLKKMYKVRSAVIHHAKNSFIEIEELKKLQIIVISLLLNLVFKSRTYKNKNEIFKEIDDAILAAY